eukprot:gene12541-19024_t
MIFLGFGFAFHLVFGTDLQGYSTIGGSLMRVFGLFRGKVDLDTLSESNRVLAPLYMTAICIIIILVGNPMVLAIVQRSYHLAPDRLMGRKTPVTMIYILLENLEAVPDLTRRQRDDIRTFRNEVEHAPNDNDLFNDVLRAFDRKINRTMTVRDFETLRDTLHAAKYRRKKGEEGGSESGSEDSEPGSPTGSVKGEEKPAKDAPESTIGGSTMAGDKDEDESSSSEGHQKEQ